MPIYHYRAKKGPSKIVEGDIEASSKELAMKRIEEMGYFPIKLEEAASFTKSSLKVPGRVKPKNITLATRQLASLLRAGVPLLRSLEIISSQATEKSFKSIFEKIHSDIKEGGSLSSAISNYPRIFSNFYVFMIKAGENSAQLAQSLATIANYREKQQDIVSKVKSALVYPLVMLLVGLGTVIFMLTFVMPRLMDIFSDIKEQLPLITKILIFLSDFIKNNWPYLLGSICLIIFIILRERKKKYFNAGLSRLKLQIPFIKNFELKKELARFSRTLEVLIRSGIPILKALGLTIPILDNQVFKKDFLRAKEELEDGASLGNSLKKSKLFPSFVISLISIGEESGRLDAALGELADNYEKELDGSIKIFTTLLEPVLILIMGLLVGFVVMAMLLPIFQINIMIR